MNYIFKLLSNWLPKLEDLEIPIYVDPFIYGAC